MRTNTRCAHLIVGAAVVATAVSGCVSGGRTSNPDASGQDQGCPFEVDEAVKSEVRIAYQHIPNGDLIVRDQQVLEKCMPNAKITWNKFASGGDVIQAFGSDSADLGLIGSSPAAKALSAPLKEDMDIQVIWVHDLIGPAESLAVKDKGINDIQGLEGKKIAVPFASTAHYSLLTALDKAGMTGSDAPRLINLAPDAMVPAWQRGEIDAAYVWDPVLTQLLADGQTIYSSEDAAENGAPTFDLAAATRAFISDNPEFMITWTRAQDWAVRQIKEDPKTAAESVGVQLGLDPAAVEKQFGGYTYLDASEQAGEDYFGGDAMGDNIEKSAEFLKDQGEVDAVGKDEDYVAGVYPDAITEVAAR